MRQFFGQRNYRKFIWFGRCAAIRQFFYTSPQTLLNVAPAIADSVVPTALQVNRFPDGTVAILSEKKPPLYFTGLDADTIWAEFQKMRGRFSEEQSLKIQVPELNQTACASCTSDRVIKKFFSSRKPIPVRTDTSKICIPGRRARSDDDENHSRYYYGVSVNVSVVFLFTADLE
jgi:hypothetical protein